MTLDELLSFIKESKKVGLGEGEIKKSLKDAGWHDGDIDEAFKSLAQSDRSGPSEIQNPDFASDSPFSKIKTIKRSSYLKYAVGVILILAISFSLYKFFGPEKVAISEFTLTASAADAAGINPDSTFTLNSTVDLDEDVIEKYLSVEPKVEIKVNKTSVGIFEIKPKSKLPENKILAVRIDAGPIADKTFSWAYQVKAPFQVVGTLPRDKGTGVPLNSGIEVTLNREGVRNPENYFEINPNVPGRLEVRRNILTFIPTQELQAQSVYAVTLKKGLKIEGSDDTISEDKVFRFETGSKGYGYGSSFSFDRTFWEFKPNLEPSFEVNSYQLESKRLSGDAYRFDSLDEFLGAYKSSVSFENGWSQYNRYKPYSAPDNKRFFTGQFFIERQLNVELVRIPQKLNEGFYLFDIAVDGRHEQAWFQVTALSNYMAVSGKDSLVWVRSLDGGWPISNADISFNGQKMGKTDADGVVQFETPADLIAKSNDDYYYGSRSGYFYTVNANGKEVAIPIEGRYGGFSKVMRPDQWWSYLSVDKTIYQPDDTLRFWGIAKQRNGSDIKGEEIVMQLTEPVFGYSSGESTVYAETKAVISDFYTVTGELRFSGLRPGTYQLSIKRGQEIIISQSITVAAYIKPAYRLIITPGVNAAFAGDSIGFSVKGEFFDGTPVANVQVKYQSYFQKGSEGRLKLDANGRGFFTINTSYAEMQNSYYSYWPQYMSVTVMPDVAEEGEIAQSASVLIFGPHMNLRSNQSVSNQVSRSKLSLKNVVLDKIKDGEPFWVSQNYLGGPVANYPISAEVIQIIYDQKQTGTGYDPINKTTYPIYSYSRIEKSVRKADLNTDGNGEAMFEQPLEKEKTYKIVFTARDQTGRLVKEEDYAYGGSISSFGYYDTDGINLRNLTDENDYRSGDKISLQIQDNSGNALNTGNKNFIFMRVVNGSISYQISDTSNYNDTFQDSYIPNVSVVGVWFSGNRFHDTWPVNLSYNSDERRLNVKVKADKDRYKPGDQVNLSIEVKDQNGRPKQAEVNVSGLDEAAFTLNPAEQDVTNDLYRDTYSSLITRLSHFTALASGAEGGGCFLPGTEITTSTGQKKIEDIRIGDYILTKEKDYSSRLVEARVKRITSHLVKGYLVVNGYLQVTENHRIFVDGEWIKAGNIKAGDSLLDESGKAVIVKSIQEYNDWVWVHNFEVEGQHTYFADNIYVHNEEKGGGEARGDFKDVAIYQAVRTDSDGKANASFKIPDNITSWRITTQAISRDWYAGKSVDFVPVGLPFFVEATLNKIYLSGDSLIMRVRSFGTANVADPIKYKIESSTLPFKKIEKNGAKITEFDLGQVTPGKHKVVVSASAGNLEDSIAREIEVVDSYFTKGNSQYYDLSSSLTDISGNDKGFTELLFTSQERGRLYYPLLSYLWSGGVRVDQVGSRYMASVLLNRFFGDERELDSAELRSYQTQSGGMALLPYSDEDLSLSAQFADLMKGENVDVSKESLKDYFNQSLNDKKSDLSRIVMSLYGLAALDEPVLVSIQNIKNDDSLTLPDKIYVALALDVIGAKEEARAYYDDNFKSRLVIKKPYAYLDSLKTKEDNIVATALLANLAGSLREQEADGLATYARENPPTETLVNFALLGYIKKTLPQLKGGDVSFTYKTDRRSENKTLKKGEVFRLELSSDELKALRFENVNGNVGLVSFFNRATDPNQLEKDDSIGVTRRYLVNNNPANEFNEGDLVKVELSSSFKSERALPGLYQITDHLPSGLRAVTKFNVQPLQAGKCISYPSMVEDQKVTFLDWNPKSTYCPNIYYYARVVSKGTYKAEPALIQSTKNLESLNVSSANQVNIR